MKQQKLTVLIVDDSEDDALLLQRHLRQSFAEVIMQRVDQQELLCQQLRQTSWDIILCDIKMPVLDVCSVLKLLKSCHVDTPLIVVSGHVEMEDTINLMHHGATDFVRKDDPVRLTPSIKRALAETKTKNEKKQAIEALHQAKHDAEQANQAKTNFLMVMNHELRTPLHGIIGMLDLLAERNQSWSEEQQTFLQTARSSSKSLSNLINDILDLTAAESGHLHINQEEFDLPACLEGALAPFLLAVNEKGLSFELNIKQLPRLVQGDETRFRQVVLNLVGNAMKFTEQGKIEVLAEMHVNGSGHDYLYFSVADTGYGIAPEQLDQVFQPFVQFKHAGNQQAGTGLGTSIVKQFVDMMGGQVWVKSVLEQGSCFSFEIPLHVVPASKGQAIEYVNHLFQTGDHHILPHQSNVKSPRISAEHAPRILLVEDDAISQQIAERRLKRAGLSVCLANNGVEAWQMIQHSHAAYDVLLTDLRMPGLDGIKLTQKVRHFEHEENLPPLTIIGLSAHALHDVKQQCLAVGMNSFLSKPIASEQVLNAILQSSGEHHEV